MKKTTMIAVTALAMLTSCASPNAWKDLNDGQGLRGWAGIPLRESMPMGIAALQQQQMINEVQRHNRAMENAAMFNSRGHWISGPNWQTWYVY
jgi:hypothetical protein